MRRGEYQGGKSMCPAQSNTPASAGAENWHETYEVPQKLRRKVRVRTDIDPKKTFERAEEVVRKLALTYADKLAEDIELLAVLCEKYRKQRDPGSLGELFSLIHNMRGQGRTFGYPLITEIGSSYCRYVTELPKGRMPSPAIIIHHLEAMKAVYREGLKGNGNQTALEVMKGLRAAVDKDITYGGSA